MGKEVLENFRTFAANLNWGERFAGQFVANLAYVSAESNFSDEECSVDISDWAISPTSGLPRSSDGRAPNAPPKGRGTGHDGKRKPWKTNDIQMKDRLRHPHGNAVVRTWAERRSADIAILPAEFCVTI